MALLSLLPAAVRGQESAPVGPKSVATGQETAPAPALTLDRAVELALAANQSLERARLEVDAARAGLVEAQAASRPTVDANAGLAYLVNPPDGITIPAGAFGTVTDPSSTFPARVPDSPVVLVDDPENLGVSLALQIDQPLYTWGKLRAGERAASAGVDASRSRMDLSRREVTRQVSRAFAAVAAARESLPLVEEIVRVLQDRVADAQAQLDAGATTPVAVLAERSRAAYARLQLVRAEQGLASALASLELLIGREPGDLASVPLPNELPPESILVERSLDGHPRLGELRATSAQAAVQVDVASASRPFRPDVGLSVKAEAQGQRLPLVQANWIDSWDANLTVSVGASVSLYDAGAGLAKLDAASARYGQALSAVAELADSLPLQLRAAYEQYAVATARMDLGEARVAAAEEQRRVAEVGFENELVTRGDLMGATVGVLEARLERIGARLDADLALAELEYLAGPIR